MTRPTFLRLAPALAALVALAPGARADSTPFVVNVSSPSAPSMTVGYVNFSNLIYSLMNAQSAFSAYSNAAYTANVNFLGITNAMTATSNASGTTVQVQIPLIGFNKTFTGSTRGEVQRQVRDFLLKNGNGVMGAFLKAVAVNSPVAVTDGNPNAATATMANQSFASYGFTPVDQLSYPQGATVRPRYSGVGLGLNSGKFTTDQFSGSMTQVDIPFEKQMSERVSVTASIPLEYVDVNGGKIYGAGVLLGLPVRLVAMDERQPWSWKLTPSAGATFQASKDLAGGGVIYSGGLTSSVERRVSPRVVLGMVNQISAYHSAKVTYSEYTLDPMVSQEIAKNGVRMAVLLSPRVVGDLFYVHTNFLEPAAVRHFSTVGASLTTRLKGMNLGLAGNSDSGPGFKSWSVGLSSAWRF